MQGKHFMIFKILYAKKKKAENLGKVEMFNYIIKTTKV